MNWFREPLQIYYRALGLLWQVSPAQLILQIILQFALALFPLGILRATQLLFDRLAQSASSEELWLSLIWLGGAQLGLILVSVLNSYVVNQFQQLLIDQTSAQILEKSIQIPFPYFEDASYHDSLHLAQKQSIYRLPQFFLQFQSVFSNGLSLLFLLGYFFTLLSSYTWLILIVALPFTILKWYTGYALHKLEKKQVPQEREAHYVHMVLTTENYALEVRSLHFGDRLIAKFRSLRRKIYTDKAKLQSRLMQWSAVVESGEVLVLLFILFQLVQKARLETGEWGVIVVYLQGIQKLQGNLKSFLNSFAQLLQQRLFLRDLFRFFDIPVEPHHSIHSELPMTDWSISVNHLTFSYPGSSSPVLHNISMKFPQGKTVGIVGANGSGKSTLIKCLAKIYEPSSGHITVGNQSLNQLNPSWWRSQSLFLFQEFQKYFFTLDEIVALGPKDSSPDPTQVENALKSVDLWSHVQQLPAQMKTKIGRMFSSGQGLSGGQWQKLAISRAFYRNPHILVLDEPTSSIDALAESDILEKLHESADQRVTILVTHRLYNLKKADWIYVMEQGRVVQEGDFDTLSQQDGLFKRLFANQKFG